MQRVAQLLLSIIPHVNDNIRISLCLRVALAEDLLFGDDLDIRIIVGAPDVVLEVANVDPPVPAIT
jgi:hypothetical protein